MKNMISLSGNNLADRTRTETLIDVIMHYDKWMFDEPSVNGRDRWEMAESHKNEYEKAMKTLEKRGILELNWVD